jgi:hypothetical protein
VNKEWGEYKGEGVVSGNSYACKAVFEDQCFDVNDNNVCDTGEKGTSEEIFIIDWIPTEPVCGNGVCDKLETPEVCAADCDAANWNPVVGGTFIKGFAFEDGSAEPDCDGVMHWAPSTEEYPVCDECDYQWAVKNTVLYSDCSFLEAGQAASYFGLGVNLSTETLYVNQDGVAGKWVMTLAKGTLEGTSIVATSTSSGCIDLNDNEVCDEGETADVSELFIVFW